MTAKLNGRIASLEAKQRVLRRAVMKSEVERPTDEELMALATRHLSKCGNERALTDDQIVALSDDEIVEMLAPALEELRRERA